MKAKVKNVSSTSELSGVSNESSGKVSKKKGKHHGFSSDLVSVMKSMSQNDLAEKTKKNKKKKVKKNTGVPKETEMPIESIPEEINSIENSDATKNGQIANSVEVELPPVNTLELKNPGLSKSKNRKKKELRSKNRKSDDGTQDERTVFVGNVNLNVGKRKLARFFSSYGKVEAVRLRSAAPAQPEVSKKEAVVKRNVHPSRSTVNAYVRFETVEMMEAALKANGALFEGNHVWVDRSVQPKAHDRRCAVFVGNLPFECEEEDLFKHFEECGEIDNVRIIRDKKFSSGKGFGYVNFRSSDAVEVALQLDGKLFKKRNLRIQRCVKKVKKFQKKGQELPQDGQSLGFMKVKGSSRMSLKFMKNKNKQGKGGSRGKGQKNNTEGLSSGKFSGQEMIRSDKFKKMQKSKKKPSKEEKRRRFISHVLTGSNSKKKPREKKTTKNKSR
ncbi:RNA-binding protein 34-like isoform X2 [Palaemon carinicauda]